MINEIWKNIKGYEGHYQVSDFGRIKSIKFTGHRIIKSQEYKGYRKVGFCMFGEKKSKSVHRLVAETFVPKNCITHNEVNHINGLKNDNRPKNLEWCTHAHNMNHASVENLLQKGIDTYSNKLSEKNVLLIRGLYQNGGSTYRSLAKEFGVCYKTIGSIIKRVKWKHI